MKEKQKNFSPGEISQKEWRRLIMLFFTGILATWFIYYSQITLGEEKNKKEENKDKQKLFHQKEKNLSIQNQTILKNFLPFEEDTSILDDIKDDKFRYTFPYYYLVHQVLSVPKEEIAQRSKPINWNVFTSQEGRDELRGQYLQIRGNLVKLLEQHTLKGEEAHARGLENFTIWRGAILDPDNKLYLIELTQQPPKYEKWDFVTLNGVFFKVWFYESQKGKEANAPIIIGRTFQVRQSTALPAPSKTSSWLTPIFTAVLILTFLLLGLAIILEQKEVKNYHYQQKQRRAKRRKKENKDDV